MRGASRGPFSQPRPRAPARGLHAEQSPPLGSFCKYFSKIRGFYQSSVCLLTGSPGAQGGVEGVSAPPCRRDTALAPRGAPAPPSQEGARAFTRSFHRGRARGPHCYLSGQGPSGQVLRAHTLLPRQPRHGGEDPCGPRSRPARDPVGTEAARPGVPGLGDASGVQGRPSAEASLARLLCALGQASSVRLCAGVRGL